ncbi:isocitrate lyase/PEP mutase family protein [Aurantimonas sp. A2-1-M11]|uniref:isocitrate lyase/PEP mutase family protein n=1 Tax=Aurantimonas sp. A2-1-M11 TaxID=3113712 RepID=UPI002F92B6C1
MTSLKNILAEPSCVVAPGIYDMISTHLAIAAKARILYMTGYGTVASHLGIPDAGLASFRDMIDRVTVMGRAAREAGIPLVADGDTGYGGLLNVDMTVKEYERAGASAIQLEDQVFPKKCGHTPNRPVVPKQEMADKIRVAVEARRSDDFLIIARTDARSEQGLDEAMDRMAAYDDAGADILFVESPESEDELRLIGERFPHKPLVANMVEGGRTPVLDATRLGELGFSLAIFPAIGFLSTAKALERAYSDLVATGASSGKDDLYSFEQFNRMIGFERVWEFDKRHARA